jgi:hypothetical protein
VPEQDLAKLVADLQARHDAYRDVLMELIATLDLNVDRGHITFVNRAAAEQFTGYLVRARHRVKLAEVKA